MLVAAQVRQPWDSGLPTDVTVNTWHFEGPDVITNFTNIVDMLHDFYNVVPTGQASRVRGIMSSLLTELMEYRLYNVADPEPRTPVHQETRTASAPGATTLPTEVALCLSYQADSASGQPQARRRGRIFLGPWSLDADDSATGRPSPSLPLVMRAAARDLLLASNASLDNTWVIFSPTAGTFQPVTNGWVDDAWDTQRSRGLDPATRSIWDDATP